MYLPLTFDYKYPFFRKVEKPVAEKSFLLSAKGKFSYTIAGKGEPIILLYGLFGSAENYSSVVSRLKDHYKLIIPDLPVHDLGMNISVSALTDHVHDLLELLQLDKVHLVGNSLGGHIALLYTLQHPEKVKSLTLVGSSGLFENGMGDTYPKRGDYDYIRQRAETTFFHPHIASKTMVDEIFETVNNRIKALHILYLAKSTIKFNLKDDLSNIKCNCCIIWGKQDRVTPPHVAKEFNKLIPQSSLHWIDQCGHVPMLETPESFNNILWNFLNGIK